MVGEERGREKSTSYCMVKSLREKMSVSSVNFELFSWTEVLSMWIINSFIQTVLSCTYAVWLIVLSAVRDSKRRQKDPIPDKLIGYSRKHIMRDGDGDNDDGKIETWLNTET